jgi:hypothetical protein
VVSLTLTEASLMMVVVQVSLMTVIYKCNMFIAEVTGEFHGTTAADAMKITDEFYPLWAKCSGNLGLYHPRLGCPYPIVWSTKAISLIPQHSRLTRRIGSSNPGDLSTKSLVWVIQILESGDLNHRI